MTQKIAYFGPEGTFTEAAAKHYLTVAGALANHVTLIPYTTILETILAAEQHATDKAVVPMENLIEGSVPITLDMLVNSDDLLIEQEIDLPIVQNLIGRPGTTLDQITTIASHPHAIAQCQMFLHRQWPAKAIRYILADESTASAAKMLAKIKDPTIAAIGSRNAAVLYQLEILAEAIEDYKDNVTRFVVLGREPMPPTGADKTSIVFSLAKDKPGGLYEALGELACRELNMTKIESRPAKTELGDYHFFIDLEGHQTDQAVAEALAAVRQRASFFRLLGSYPRYRKGE